MATVDSANTVHITVHEMALFLRGKRSELICHLLFECLSLCVHAGRCVNTRVPAQVSGSWQEVGWLLAFALLQRTTLLPAVPELCFFYDCVWAELIRYSPKPEHRWNPVGHSLAGWSPGNAAQGEQQLEMPWRRQSGCKSGISQVLISNIMGNSQRKGFWGAREPSSVMVSILWDCFVCWLDWAIPLLCCFLVGSQDLCSRWVFLSWLKRQSCIAF